MRRATRRASGFSLLEVTASLSVLGVLAALLHGGRAGGDLHFAESLQRSTAHHCASARLEALRSGVVEWNAGEQRFDLEERVTRILVGGSLVQEIQERRPGLYDVKVAVRWGAGKAREREVALETVLRRGESR